MNFFKTTLKNGLRVVMAPVPSMESATVQVLIGAGSRDEKPGVSGLAHFLEHMVFKGTAKYPSSQLISSTIDGIGGEINANTSKERTAYYIKAWERYLTLSFDILSGFIKDPILKAGEIEKEKGVIIEEIAMYEDLPMQKVANYFEELLYGESSLGLDIAGTKETVMTIKKHDFDDFRKRFYVPENMVLTVAGSFDKKQVLELAEEYFGQLGNSAQGSVLRKEDPTSPRLRGASKKNPGGKPQLKVVNKKTEQGHLIVGVRGNAVGNKNRYKEAVLASILGGGMSSRLWTEVREKRGLAYYVRTEIEHFQDQGYLDTRAGIKIGKIEEAIKIILEEYDKLKTPLRQGSVGQAEIELKKAKEYLKGRLALALEDTHSVSEFFGDQELTEGKIRSVDEVMRGIDSVTAEGVQELAEEFFQNSRLNMAIVGPYEDEAKFKQILKL